MFCMFASLSVGFGTWVQNGQSSQFTISRNWKQSEVIAKKTIFFRAPPSRFAIAFARSNRQKITPVLQVTFKSVSCLTV